MYSLYQGLIKRERACNSHSDSIDSKIESVTKNIVIQKLGLLVYWRYWGCIIIIQKIQNFPKLSVAKNGNTCYFTIENFIHDGNKLTPS